MAHVRPDAKTSKHRISACKKGRHNYGMAQYVGAGIRRQVCQTCGAVSIDLTNVDDTLQAPLAQSQRTNSSGPSEES